MSRVACLAVMAALVAMLPGCDQGRYQFVAKPTSNGGAVIYACDTRTGTYFHASHVDQPGSKR
jgi:hypothetical protein